MFRGEVKSRDLGCNIYFSALITGGWVAGQTGTAHQIDQDVDVLRLKEGETHSLGGVYLMTSSAIQIR
jgi:hypothetical protein